MTPGWESSVKPAADGCLWQVWLSFVPPQHSQVCVCQEGGSSSLMSSLPHLLLLFLVHKAPQQQEAHESSLRRPVVAVWLAVSPPQARREPAETQRDVFPKKTCLQKINAAERKEKNISSPRLLPPHVFTGTRNIWTGLSPLDAARRLKISYIMQDIMHSDICDFQSGLQQFLKYLYHLCLSANVPKAPTCYDPWMHLESHRRSRGLSELWCALFDVLDWRGDSRQSLKLRIVESSLGNRRRSFTPRQHRTLARVSSTRNYWDALSVWDKLKSEEQWG